eukprot:SAG11_NODE_13817_length_638_cov_0.461967_1_plen_63_part_10
MEAMAAASRLKKEYKELNRELQSQDVDKEISLMPVDDGSIFEWRVSQASRPQALPGCCRVVTE